MGLSGYDGGAERMWAIVEVVGRTRLAGEISGYTFGGASFVRVDVPAVGESRGYSRLLGPTAIHSILPVSEERAIEIIEMGVARPLEEWDFPERVRKEIAIGREVVRAGATEIKEKSKAFLKDARTFVGRFGDLTIPAEIFDDDILSKSRSWLQDIIEREIGKIRERCEREVATGPDGPVYGGPKEEEIRKEMEATAQKIFAASLEKSPSDIEAESLQAASKTAVFGAVTRPAESYFEEEDDVEVVDDGTEPVDDAEDLTPESLVNGDGRGSDLPDGF